MAKQSRIRGLMCSTSNVIKRRFYNRDVSAALNIRRIAAGPGRPRELSSWLGRPAMPNPGTAGQEWVDVRDKGLLRKWQRPDKSPGEAPASSHTAFAASHSIHAPRSSERRKRKGGLPMARRLRSCKAQPQRARSLERQSGGILEEPGAQEQ
ncbi:hypothetical protein QJQ45_005283 [Haematococcus lacustris]|nr:hypothetical protein QJQ45_005283 [Haematococcus lacustris]